MQDSLYRMGEEALAAAFDICEIMLGMPNVRYLPIDLSPEGSTGHYWRELTLQR